MPTRFASSIDGAPILANRAYADQYGLNIDQYYAKKTELFSGDYDDLTNKPDLSVYALASSVPTKTSDLTNDSGFITLNDVPMQVQSDWDEVDVTSPAYIRNKPDLSVYALSSNLATVATSGDYNDLSNKPDLSVYALITDIPNVPVQDVQVDNQSVLDANGVAKIPALFSGNYNDLSNKPDLSVYALSSSLATVATSGDYNDLTNKPTIPAAQIQSDWSQTNSSALDYIKNKPDLSVYALASSLASVATSGDYNDLTNKPSIPAAQVQSDYAQSDSSAVDYIKNKPDLSVYALATDLPTFVEGQNVHISTSGTQVTISADDTTYTAGDGINIDDGVISVDTDDVKIDYWHGGSSAALASGNNLNANVSATAYRGTNIYVSGGAITLKPGTYAVNAFLKVNNTNTTLDDDSYKLSFSGGITGGNPTIAYNFDNSFRHEEVFEVSFLTVNLGSTDAALVLTTDALSVLSGVSVTLTYAQVYCLSGIVGASGSGGGGAAVITLSSNDHSVTINESTIGDVKNFDLSVPAQVNADWNSSSGKSQILNKPDLSVYALSANLATVATSGSYNDLSDKPTIPSAPVQSNWTESNTSSLAYIQNKPDLSAYALKSELATVATSGSYNDLSDKPTIPTQVQSDWTEADNTDPSYIQNKPSQLALMAGTNVTLVEDSVNNTLTINSTGGGGGGSQVQANWAETDTSDPSYIQNKPDLSVYALSASLATVATSGDYSDLINKPTIVSPVQSNWNESDSSSLAYILNKPTLFSGNYNDLTNKPDLSVYALANSLAAVATSGDYDDLTNKPTLFSGNYNDLTNKPDLSVYALSSSLATVATSGSYNDLSNKPTIPTYNETVLWSGSSDLDISNNSLVLSESTQNFERVLILFRNNDGYGSSIQIDPATMSAFAIDTITPLSNGNTYIKSVAVSTSDHITWSAVASSGQYRWKTSDGTATSFGSGSNLYIHKVIGINRIANN